MSSQITLSSLQEKAVTAPWRGTINMILSTAGSGKTLTLTRRAVWIAQQLVLAKAQHARLLCVCFNKSAAAEMFERINEELACHNLHDKVFVTTNAFSLMNMVTIEVRTFHALGFWVLRSATPKQRCSIGVGSGNLNLIKAEKLHALILEGLREAGEVPPHMKDKAAKAMARSVAKDFSERKRRLCDMECQARFMPDEGLSSPSGIRQASTVFEVCQKRMQEQNAIEYSDMISKSIELALKDSEVRTKLQTRYTTVLVDEFQDMSPSDFTLCKFFVDETKSLTVVGDDDQRIYSFRSSKSWFCHEMIANCFPVEVKVFCLPENRRCPGAVVKSADAVIRHNSRRFGKDVTSLRADGSPVRIIGCTSKALEIRFVTKSIKALLPKVRQTGDQILVLFRINALLQEFKKSFRAAGIETSHVIVTHGTAETVGPKTLATFALILLMSKAVERETFIWAATTVSPTLERTSIEKIIDSQAEEGHIDAPAEEAAHTGGAEAVVVRQSNNRSYPSPLLTKVTSWYEMHKASQVDENTSSDVNAVHSLLALSDELLVRLRRETSMEAIVRSAESILSSDGDDMFEASMNEPGSQGQVDDSQGAAETNAGFDKLLNAARSIDVSWVPPSSLSSRDAPSFGASAPADDDTEDFSSLFSRDEHSRSQKRRKSQGVTRSQGSNRSKPLTKETIGLRLQKLCDQLSEVLLASNQEDPRPSSRNSRPTTVLSTIHRAKGAQFPYVFLCGADKYNLPNGAGRLIEMGGSVDLQSTEIQEERRMFFVSLTRTQKEFTCTYSIPWETPRGSPGQWRSPFLDELIEGVEGSAGCAYETFVESESDIYKALRNVQERDF